MLLRLQGKYRSCVALVRVGRNQGRPKENLRPIIHGPHSSLVWGRNQTRRLRRRREFNTTEIEDAVIAKAANMGLMRMPKKG